MPSYTILNESVATMDGVEGKVFEVVLKTDNEYQEVQKYFATEENKIAILEEAARSFENSQPKKEEVKIEEERIEVEVTL
jgi:hypothetical protein